MYAHENHANCKRFGGGGGVGSTPLQGASGDCHCATGWGCIFMTGVTIMGLHFQ